MVTCFRPALAGLIAALAMFSGGIAAQGYPTKPVRMIAPFPAGTAPDVLARLIGENFASALGQPVIVENRVGAAGNVASDVVAKSAPDGYTLYLAAHPPFTLNPLLYARAPYDPVKDFSPISLVGTQSFVLVVNPSVPARTVQELIAHVKANPGRLSYNSQGVGTPHHLGMEYLKVALGLDIVHVPYNGPSNVIPDLLTGVIPMALTSITVAGAHLKSGKLIPLAVTSRQRWAALPGVPTIAETVVPNYEVSAWFAVLAPARTPRELITRLNAEAVRAIAKPEMVNRLAGFGLDPQSSTPEGLADIIKSEIVKWGHVIKEGKLKVD